jgi:hypothetical protein
MHTKNDVMNKILDRFSLSTAIFVEAAVLAICFVVVSPGVLEAVAMGILGVVVILFSVRAWIKGGVKGKFTWALFVFVGVFFDLSFVMLSTDSVALGTGEKDPELARLDAALVIATTEYSAAQARYDAGLERGNSKTVLDSIKSTVDDTKASKDKAEEARNARFLAIESGQATTRRPLTADGLSTAIYDAAESGKPGRITFLFAFFCLFLGMQLTVITAASDTKRAAIEEEPGKVSEPAPAVHSHRPLKAGSVERFTRLAWSNYRIKRSPNVLKLASFKNLDKGTFSDDEYYHMVSLCTDLGLIDQQGKVLVDENKSLESLKKVVDNVV